MTQVAAAHSFISAMAELDKASVEQTIVFLEQLIRQPDQVPAEMNVGHDALEYCAESFKVNEHVRAIARRDGDSILMLYVGPCNDAQDWAASHCFAHGRPRAGRRIAVGEIPRGVVPGLPGASATEAWYCPLSNPTQLREALEVAGINRPTY